jgi:hypothetical protein
MVSDFYDQSGAEPSRIPRLDPIALVQNPAFGAHLLWSFGRSYHEEKIGQYPIMQIYFLVLPLVLHAQSLAEIKSTQTASGLSKFAAKRAAPPTTYSGPRPYAPDARIDVSVAWNWNCL